MALASFEQICFVVHDIQKEIAKWVSLGAGPFYLREVHFSPGRNFNYRGREAKDSCVICLGFFGNTQIELSQPLDTEPSIFREVLDSKGEGVHHLQPRCRPLAAEEFDSEFRRYESLGLEPGLSLQLPDSSRVVFFDGMAKYGFFIELVERPLATFKENLKMYGEHCAWDGNDPVRAFENRPR